MLIFMTLMPALCTFWRRPELLNRLDEVVVFRQLTAPDVRRIAELELAQLAKRLVARGVDLDVSGAVMQLVCTQGYDQVWQGAMLYWFGQT